MHSNEGTPTPDDGASLQSGAMAYADRGEVNPPLSKRVMEFNDKLVEVFHSPLQPSSTPDHLQHRFLVCSLSLFLCW